MKQILRSKSAASIDGNTLSFNDLKKKSFINFNAFFLEFFKYSRFLFYKFYSSKEYFCPSGKLLNFGFKSNDIKFICILFI